MNREDIRRRRAELLSRYDGRAPRYTSYPTAVQFTPAVDADAYAGWLEALPVDQPVSLYIHIPFCARLCWYCGCNTRVVNRPEVIRDYVDHLLAEIALVAERLPAPLTASHVHFGGGTPNMLAPDDLDRLFDGLRRHFIINRGAEIASELDPAQLTADWAFAAARNGLNRASLGIQDLAPAVQAAVNRIEPFAVVARAVEALRAAGVEGVNFDLMYGLPRQTTADVLSTLDQVLTLAPDRVALFGYAHVPWMKAHQKLIDELQLPGPEARLDQSDRAAERLESGGYRAVGLDHFALPSDPLAGGAVRRNFQGYTTDAASTLIGLGASSIGRLPGGYVQNQSAEVPWRREIAAGRLAAARGVALTPDDRFRGEIIERLMCDFTVDLAAVCRAHGRRTGELIGSIGRLADAFDDGVAELSGNQLSVTDLGRPFLRHVCAAFDAHIAPAALRHSAVV